MRSEVKPGLARPGTVTEALALAATWPSAVYLAGGTEVFPEVGPAGDRRVPIISLRDIAGLRDIEVGPGAIRIGAAVTIDELLRSPDLRVQAGMIVRASKSLATRQVRARATVGGNIAANRADHTLPPCLLAQEAEVELAHGAGENRVVPLAEYLRRRDQRDLVDAIVTAVTWTPRPGSFAEFTRVGPRNGPSYAIASTALVVDRSARTVRLGVGGAATPYRAEHAEAFAERAINWESGIVELEACSEFGRLAALDGHPADDTLSSAAYRSHAVSVMARRLLARAMEGAEDAVE